MITARTDLEAARARLSTLKTQRPAQKLRLYLVEGEILTEHEKYTEALQVYSEALVEVPDNADLLYVRAMDDGARSQVDIGT
ncbi:MAG: Uncharacterized protein FD130_1671 [Halothiobacillaceae bacterium]|nr:MAG: Uncharacterized protein FD130_1671 [Halothiobacillaceae bacterium]